MDIDGKVRWNFGQLEFNIMSNKDNDAEIENLEAEQNFLSGVSDHRWTEAKENANERLKEAQNSETEELSDSEEMDKKLKQLEKEYDHFSRLSRPETTGNPEVYRKMAEDRLQQMIDLKKEEVAELAHSHNRIKGTDHIAINRRKGIEEDYNEARAEMTELSAKLESDE